MSDFERVVGLYADHLARKAPDIWQEWTDGVEPTTGCAGYMYEVPNPLARLDEDFEIAVAVEEPDDLGRVPYYHNRDDQEEAYVVIQGMGLVALGVSTHEVREGDSLIIPRIRYHMVRPVGQLVMAVINRPPLEPGQTDSWQVRDTDPNRADLIRNFNKHPLPV